MKHIIILGDGMADHPVARLDGKTLLQHANTPNIDRLAREGRNGLLITVPDGFHPGSEVANTSIMGYDLPRVYEGRGPLEAASIGYEMRPNDLALRCNIISLDGDRVKNHHAGHLATDEGDCLVQALNESLGDDRVRFITGIQYRHLLVIRGGSKHIEFFPPHDHPGERWRGLLCRPKPGVDPDTAEPGKMTPRQTADLINSLMLRSMPLLAEHPVNTARRTAGADTADIIWPWGGGYRPDMQPLSAMYPQVRSGSVISAVDLIRGIGRYAGLKIIKVPGATGLYNTNYAGKTQAAIDALRTDDFVFLHIEASDEAGHDGDLELKLRTIENLDSLVVGPVAREVETWDEPVCIAVLPDHPTPVELRTHVSEPVPFLIWHKGIEADSVQSFDEISAAAGSYGLLRLTEFMREFMAAGSPS